jgi:hypothetical protein
MALPPRKGEWARSRAVPYSGYRVWGTGINDIHMRYGGPPLRMDPLSMREGEITPPHESVPQQLIPAETWGYQPEDSLYTGVQYDDRPAYDVSPEDSLVRHSSQGQPPWNASGAAKSLFRALKGGAFPWYIYRDGMKQIPNETVSEGWENKPQGQPANSKPSDPSQYEMQTSMQQRYRTRNNDHAVARGADNPRTGIESRVIGQRLKVYSGKERHYDMFPFQQDEIPRPFYYRTAGTGREEDMTPNTMYDIAPIQRTPPPDPSLGESDTDLSFGYTQEDQFYA